MIIYIHTFKKVVYNNPWKIENSGIGVFPHYFEFSIYWTNLSFSRDTPIKEKRERKNTRIRA